MISAPQRMLSTRWNNPHQYCMGEKGVAAVLIA